MRELNPMELAAVTGGAGQCTAEDANNTYWGVSNTQGVGDDIVNIYEGLVFATSHIIERVANAL